MSNKNNEKPNKGKFENGNKLGKKFENGNNANPNGRPKRQLTVLSQLNPENNISKAEIRAVTNSLMGATADEIKKIAKNPDLSMAERAILTLVTSKHRDAQKLKDVIKIGGIDLDKTDDLVGSDDALYFQMLGKVFAQMQVSCLDKIKSELFNCKNQYVILYGGRDSGKSHGTAEYVMLNLILDAPFRGILIRRNQNTVKFSQFQKIKDIIVNYELSEWFKINEQEGSITFIRNGNLLISRGFKDANSASKLKSLADFHFVWYEEPNTDGVTYSDWQTLDKSLRTSNEGSLVQSIFTFNSDDPNTWLKSVFFPDGLAFEDRLPNKPIIDAKYEDTKIIHFTYKDNKYVDEKRKEKLEQLKEKDPKYYKVWTQGLWGGDPQSKILQNWQIVDSMPQYADTISYGVDWGYNDPMTLIEVRLYDNELYVQEHFYESFKQVDIDFIPYISANCDLTANFYCDHRPDNVKMLQNSGLYAQNADKSILEGLGCLRYYKINVVNNSPNLIKEMKSYSWVFNDKIGKYIDKPIDLDNHAIDAMRYAVYSSPDIVARYKNAMKKDDRF